MSPKRLVVIGALLVLLSGAGLLVIREMRPMSLQPEFPRWNQMFEQRWRVGFLLLAAAVARGRRRDLM